MQTIRIKDKTFAIAISAEELEGQVCRVASEINRDYEGQRPLLLAVLNGSFVFASDLIRKLTLECKVSFVKLASYQGEYSEGKVRDIIGLDTDIEGQHVIIVEDIIDTGLTMRHMVETLKRYNPASVNICTLLLKPGKLQTELDVRYCAMRVPDDFLVGYGLDYDGLGRNYKDIYSIIHY